MQHIDNKSDLNDGYEAYFFVQTVLWRSQFVMLLNYSHCFVHQIFVSEGN